VQQLNSIRRRDQAGAISVMPAMQQHWRFAHGSAGSFTSFMAVELFDLAQGTIL